MSAFVLLALADGRFPSGAGVHSGGVEAAVADGRITAMADLEVFLLGRLRTIGLVEAALAAATWARCPVPPLDALVAEADARCASPALRRVARTAGRQLLRSALIMWPSAPELGEALAAEAPLAVAQGAVGYAAGATLRGTASVTAYQSVVGAATAAVRLLGLDPRAVHALVFALAPELERVAIEATAAAAGPLADLPGPSSALVELAAERHARAEVRLFAS